MSPDCGMVRYVNQVAEPTCLLGRAAAGAAGCWSHVWLARGLQQEAAGAAMTKQEAAHECTERQ